MEATLSHNKAKRHTGTKRRKSKPSGQTKKSRKTESASKQWLPLCTQGCFEAALALPTVGVDYHATDRAGNHALIYAAIHDASVATAKLLKLGLDPEHRNAEGLRAMDIAVGLGHAATMAVLAQVDAKTINDFMRAGEQNDFEDMLTGLKRGLAIDTRLRHPHQFTPIMLACACGNQEAVEAMLEFKPNLSLTDAKGRTLIQIIDTYLQGWDTQQTLRNLIISKKYQALRAQQLKQNIKRQVAHLSHQLQLDALERKGFDPNRVPSQFIGTITHTIMNNPCALFRNYYDYPSIARALAQQRASGQPQHDPATRLPATASDIILLPGVKNMINQYLCQMRVELESRRQSQTQSSKVRVDLTVS